MRQANLAPDRQLISLSGCQSGKGRDKGGERKKKDREIKGSWAAW